MQTLSALDRRAVLRVEVEAQELKRALDRVKPAVANRQARPSMRAVLVHADDAGMTLCATNLDLTIRTRLHAAVTAPGSVAVAFASLRAVVGRLRGTVVLEASAQAAELAVTAKDGAAKTGLATLPLADFTDVLFRGLDDARGLDLDAVRRVLPAASRDKARPLLGVVLLNGNDVVATDSYRLYVERVTEHLPRCLLPASALTAVAATRHRSADVRVDRFAELAQLTVPDAEYLVRTVPGDWVDYKRLVPRPAETNVVATLRSEDLLDAARQLRPLTTSRSPEPPAWLALQPGRIAITVDVTDVGRGEVEIVADVTGVDRTEHVAFNLGFLAASARACCSERVSVHLRSPRQPAVIVGEGVDWDRPGSGLRLLMPMLLEPPAGVVAFKPRVIPAGGGTHDEGEVGGPPDNVVTIRELRSRRLGRRRAARS